jgi:predicted  nucleic acid-binding Zn-ribbon protein
MDSTTLITLVGTIAAAIGGKEAWAYYKKRLDVKAKLNTYGSASEVELRNEIREMLEGQIKELKDQIGLLTSRIKHLEEEREGDKKRIANQEIKITILSERLANKVSTTGRGRKKNPLDDIPTID